MKPTAINCCRAHSLTHSLTHSWTQLRRLHPSHYTTPPSDSALLSFGCLVNFSYGNSTMVTQDDSQMKPMWSSCKYTALRRPLDALCIPWLIHFLFPFPVRLARPGVSKHSGNTIPMPGDGLLTSQNRFPHPLTFVHASSSIIQLTYHNYGALQYCRKASTYRLTNKAPAVR